MLPSRCAGCAEASFCQGACVLYWRAAGLAAAHEKGIFHRDFKPATVSVGNDGRVRVLDFALASLSPWVSTVHRLCPPGPRRVRPEY